MNPEVFPNFHLFPAWERLKALGHFLTDQMHHEPGPVEVTPPEPPEVPGEERMERYWAGWLKDEIDPHNH